MEPSYDCIVIGGGPAGSTTAAVVAEAGLATLLVERDKVPRFHVGESLMPETYWTLRRIGALERMRQSTFVPKRSVQFVDPSGKESQPFFFHQHDPRDCSQTWQVERAEFDKLLMDNAAEKGAHCIDQTRALDVLSDGDRVVVVRLQRADQAPRDVSARVIVDATGQHALIANRRGLRVEDPKLRKVAIWTYYRGARRDPGENAGATVILHTQSKKSWFWSIPLQNNITSIGVVGDADYLLKGPATPDEVFEQQRQQCPGLIERLEGASRVERIRVAKEFSYFTRQQAGDGWVMVGDALGFIDPIYSSGVYFALKSGEMAGDAVVEGLRENDTSAAQLGKWTDDFQAGTRWIRKLVDAFYTEPFSFGRFIKDHPHHLGNLTDLLIGRIFYDGAGRIFDDMEPRIAQAVAAGSSGSPTE
jgi:flavin-dependent dehydrogenase